MGWLKVMSGNICTFAALKGVFGPIVSKGYDTKRTNRSQIIARNCDLVFALVHLHPISLNSDS